MAAQCTQESFEFHPQTRREIRAPRAGGLLFRAAASGSSSRFNWWQKERRPRAFRGVKNPGPWG